MTRAAPFRSGGDPTPVEDVARLGRIQGVQTALQVLRRTTGLRIALVARVTEDSWTACAVLDEAGFGLKPGDQLELRTTY